ncbi:MAG: trypsin-like serine protease [Ruminococcus sp.]|nr:trypsin-like serine protease [Ruminococcus sp.]
MKLKKIMSAVVATTTLLTGTAFHASASKATILQGDANNDNSVNVSDVAWLSRYLVGKENADSYNITCADATRDGIIDYQDHNMILDFCINKDSNKPITYQAELYDNLNNEERDYYKFSYANGEATGIEEYTLEKPVSKARTYSLLREAEEEYDYDFVRDYSNTGVVKVGNGSGFIVDDHLVLTAAHCVCGGTASNILVAEDLTVTVYNSDETTFKVYTVDSIHVPQKYFDFDDKGGSTYNVDFDYALIHIDSRYDNIPSKTFSQYEPFQIGYITKKFIEKQITVTTSGFTAIPDSSEGMHRYYSVGNIVSDSTDLRYHAYANANYGDSGGLAYYNSVYNEEVIKSAIGNITGGGEGADYDSSGVRITPTIARFIFNNEYI